jgi:hypothetical protein
MGRPCKITLSRTISRRVVSSLSEERAIPGPRKRPPLPDDDGCSPGLRRGGAGRWAAVAGEEELLGDLSRCFESLSPRPGRSAFCVLALRVGYLLPSNPTRRARHISRAPVSADFPRSRFDVSRASQPRPRNYLTKRLALHGRK